jgi:queuine tRNA-ribosyltransferase
VGSAASSLTVEAQAADCPARAGHFPTAHGEIETPAFMPVGTAATVKGLTPADLTALEPACILANTYHLWLRPGADTVRRAGGLHAFMGWPGAILTDSGGFQLLSLAHLADIHEGGAEIRSHLDGELRMLSPERAMAVQASLGSDIAMALDVCPPYPCPPEALVEATERTTRWARRSLEAEHAPCQLVFGIVQGGVDRALRRSSAEAIGEMGFDGFGIGGLSVGEEREATWPALDTVVAHLPQERPRYLMGVGSPDDVVEAISRGVDLFDCVLPTRLGRNGAVFTDHGRLDLRNAALAARHDPIDPNCDCLACTRFSLGYLHHQIRAREELGLRLASIHNVHFLVRLARDARQAILEGRFAEFRESAVPEWQRPNAAAGRADRARWLRRQGVTP